MPDLKKIEIEVPLEVTKATKADKNKASVDKMYIEFDLLYAGHAHVNKNGEGFVPEATSDKVDTITNGYINVEHEGIFNIGTVINADYVDLDNGGKVESSGILWKSVMEQFGITPEEVKGGKYKISMEVLYKDFYYLKGEETVEAEENDHLEDYIGQTYEGDYIARIIKPVEFSGCALTTQAAEQRATINKAVASKLDEYKKTLAVRTIARTPTYTGTETTSWDRPTLQEHARAKGYEGIDRVDDLSDSQRKEMAEDSLLGIVDADTYRELTFFIVVNPETNKLNKGALEAVRGGRGQQADIPQSAYDSADSKAKQLLRDEFDVEYNDNQNSEGSDNMPYKTFETEEDFNEFKENLKNDEEFLNSIAGYVKVENVLDKFDEVDLEEADDLDSLVASVKEVKENYKDLQAEVQANEILRERVVALSEIDVEFDEEEMDKEELVNMSEAAFEMWKNTLEKVKESSADENDDEDKNKKGTSKFNPNLKIKSGDDSNLGKVLKNL